MPEAISIFDIIKRGGYEASIITTFNSHLPFYEEVVLRKLVSAGCRHNVVLMDKRQCALAWHSESSRPQIAGFAYTLLPIAVSGAFHPKVCILVGPRKAAILIGSHNLTLSGFGYNQEVTNWIEVNGPKDVKGTALLKTTWAMVHRWIELERPHLADVILESALALSNFINPLIANSGECFGAKVLSQEPDQPSLFEQIYPSIPADVRRITVVGAFFDHDLAFIRALHQKWPMAQIVVGIDPNTVCLPGNPDTTIARYVDVSPLWADKHRYLHAKVFLFDNGSVDDAVLVSGSANPSGPAWLAQNRYRNVEAILLRVGREAHHAAVQMGLLGIFVQPTIQPAELSAITIRSKSEENQNNIQSNPVWGAVAQAETGELRIQCLAQLAGVSHVVLLDQNETELEAFDHVIIDNGEICLTPLCALPRIRSCLIYVGDTVLARAIVSHPEQLSLSSRSSKQHQIRNALIALGSSEADIPKLIATVAAVIFADKSIQEIDAAICEHKERKSRGPASINLETLAVSINDTPSAQKKIKLLKSGDLANLIDVLLRRLSDGLEQNIEERDKRGRSEEEQIGQDDEDTPQTPKTTLTDLAIAKAVSLKARALTRKMVRRIATAQNNATQHPAIVIQLIAVLALVRELRQLDKTKRWRQTGQSLSEESDRRYLFNHCLGFLLSSKTGCLHVIDGATDENSEETTELIVLLLWLAWDLGFELTEEAGQMWDDPEQRATLKTNGFFIKLLPSLVQDKAAEKALETSIAKTVSRTPAVQQRATGWLKRHLYYGKCWARGFVKAEKIKVGGYCYVPGIINEPRIVLGAPSATISIWDFGSEIKYTRESVVAVRPAEISDGVKTPLPAE